MSYQLSLCYSLAILPTSTMKKSFALLLIITLISNTMTTLAQSSGDTVTAPSETTIFFANPEEAKKITESADTTYLSEVESVFSQEQAQEKLNELDKGVQQLRDQIIKLDRQYGTDDAQYLETESEVVQIINDIEKTKNTLSAAIKRIYFYQKNIVTSVEKVSEIRKTLDETK